ncbi:MAG: amidase, partial [Pseudomonadota bacterium]
MSEPFATAGAIAAAVQAGRRSAAHEVETALARIAATDSSLNAFTEVLAERARTRAASLDRMPAAERARLPLAGVPFAVKNLFDIEG